MSEWRVARLSDVCEIVGRGITPQYVDDGPITVVNQKCIREGRLDLAVSRRHGGRAVTAPKLIQEGDVLVNSTGVGTLGRTAAVQTLVGPTTVDTHVTIARPSTADPGWVRYLFRLLEPSIEALAEGSTGQTELSRHRLAELEVLVPSLSEQQAIAGILGALDDKIESNRRMSATARSLCDAVFQANTDTEERLSAVSIVTMGSSPPGDTYNNRGDGLPFYQGVTDFGFLSPSRRVWTSNPIRIAEAGSTLISVRAPVGRLNEAGEKCCIGRGVASASSKNQVVLYYALRQADAVWAPFESEGTVFGSINRSDLEDAKIPWISGSRIDQVEVDLRAIHGRIRAAAAEIVTLEEVRDALLPELLSGRLRIRDAEKALEGAL